HSARTVAARLETGCDRKAQSQTDADRSVACRRRLGKEFGDSHRQGRLLDQRQRRCLFLQGWKAVFVVERAQRLPAPIFVRFERKTTGAKNERGLGSHEGGGRGRIEGRGLFHRDAKVTDRAAFVSSSAGRRIHTTFEGRGDARHQYFTGRLRLRRHVFKRRGA